VVVRVAASVKDRKTGKVLWSQTATSKAPFFVGATSTSGTPSGLQFNRVLQDRAIEQAGQFVAADLADRFLWARDQGRFQLNNENSNFAPAPGSIESPDILESQEDLLPQSPLDTRDTDSIYP
jgi:hypothetical protein